MYGLKRYGLTVTVPPAEEPLSLQEAKDHCRVDHQADDELVLSLLRAAREHAELLTMRAFVLQTLRLSLDYFPEMIRLPRPPLVAVESVRYYDPLGLLAELAVSEYQVDNESEPGVIVRKNGRSWPEIARMAGAIKVTYRAGYGGAAAVPDGIKELVKLILAHWYDNREAVIAGTMTTVPLAADSLARIYSTGEYI